jgi:Rho GTPase-activating protein 1
MILFKELHESDDVDHHLFQKVEEYKIVECRGDDKFGRKVIVCSACRLPHEDVIKNSEFKTVDKFYECLLKYILRTFDRYVDMDYVIIYFHHGLRSYNRPSYGWLMKAYVKIDRR